jgi:hypothetical protein
VTTRFYRDLLWMLCVAGALSLASRCVHAQQMTLDQAFEQQVNGAAAAADQSDLGSLLFDRNNQKARADGWQARANALRDRADAVQKALDAVTKERDDLKAKNDQLRAIILHSDAEPAP